MQNIDLPMMTSPDRYTPLPGFVTSAVALNQPGQPASINPKRAHKVVHVILQDNDVYVQWYVFKSDQGRGSPKLLLTHILFGKLCANYLWDPEIS